MTMSLEAILVAIILKKMFTSWGDMTSAVEDYYAYDKKSKGVALKRRIDTILNDESFWVHHDLMHQRGSYLSFKLGRITGKIDLS